MIELRCLGPGCTSTKLARAHLLPAGFARGLHRPGGHNVLVDREGGRRARQQLGWFDRGILCADCDRVLGRLDDHAIAICRREFPPSRAWTIDRIDDVDGDRLAAFATSVLWRVSASSLRETEGTSLGRLADRARDASFGVPGAQPLPVIANRYVSDHQEPRDFEMLPIRFRLAGLNAYTLPIGGLQLIVVADGRNRPPLPPPLDGLIVNGSRSIRSMAVRLEDTAEYMALRAVARRHVRHGDVTANGSE